MYVDTFTLTLGGVHKQRLLKERDKIDESLGVTCYSEREVSPCLSKSNAVHITDPHIELDNLISTELDSQISIELDNC